MNLLDKTILKILSSPTIIRPVEHLWHLYHVARLASVTKSNHYGLIRQIDINSLDIRSDFSERDAKALEVVTRKALKEGVRVAEIGSWKGMSTATIARTILPFNGELYAIDHWQGNEGVPEHQQSKMDDMLSLFRHNMKALNLSSVVYPLVMSSLTASRVFPDGSLDMVFIDADHRYEYVRADIEAWYPKVKRGGIIAGHDCEARYTDFGDYRKEVDRHLNEDVIVGICHAGVVKAVFDKLGHDYFIEPDSSVWWHIKR